MTTKPLIVRVALATDLLVVLGAFNMPLPRLPDAEIARMADEFLTIWRN
jgi:hypothetical protein